MPNPRGTSKAVQALADTLARSNTGDTVRVLTTTVASFTGGVVSVNVGADVVPAIRLDSYLTPAAGDVVKVLLVNGSPLVLGRPTGAPTF